MAKSKKKATSNSSDYVMKQAQQKDGKYIKKTAVIVRDKMHITKEYAEQINAQFERTGKFVEALKKAEK